MTSSIRPRSAAEGRGMDEDCSSPPAQICSFAQLLTQAAQQVARTRWLSKSLDHFVGTGGQPSHVKQLTDDTPHARQDCRGRSFGRIAVSEPSVTETFAS